MVLVKGYVKIKSTDDYIVIKDKLAQLFKERYPNLDFDSFEYLKRERQNLSVQLVPPDWEWDFENLKALFGQGNLYCRIKKDCSLLPCEEEDTNLDTEQLPSREPSSYSVVPGPSKRPRVDMSSVIEDHPRCKILNI